MPRVLAPRVAALLLTLALAALPAGAGVAEISCPGELRLDEVPAGAGPWIASPGQRRATLAGASLVNGVPGDERDPAPAVLAPDEERREGRRMTLVWHLDAYREGGLLLVCRYLESSAYLTAVLGAALSACTLSFDAIPDQGTTRYESFAASCR